MVAIHWTNEAEFWLKEIHDYIALESTTMAKKVVSDIYKKAQILQNFPQIGYTYEHIHDEEVRVLLYGHYRIAYLVKDSSHIDVLGIFHGSLNIELNIKR